MPNNLERLKRHIGRTAVAHDVASASQADRLAATLGVAHPAPDTGDTLPRGWYGIFFPPLAPTAGLRADGQPGEGPTPPVPLPRRRLESVRAAFHAPIRIGDRLKKTSEIADISVEDGTAGPVVEVKITETITAADELSVVEERLFRFFGEGGPGAPTEPPSVPETAAWSRRIEPDPVMLFRLSAVRFNAHRVHYDRDYATGVEGMPGLAVPITLVSSQMIGMLRAERPGRSLASISYRSVGRIFDLGAYTIDGAPEGDEVALWARDHEGALAVLAQAVFAARDGRPRQGVIATEGRARAGG